MTIYQSHELRTHYNEMGPGDIVVGELSAAHQNTVVLIDLLQRGVVWLPSPLSQLLSRSKVAQVDILQEFMHPLTLAIKRRKALLDAVSRYGQAGIRAVVTKEDHLHCGHGVRKWDHIEAVYSHRGLHKESYPFVLQPLVEGFRDVRVVMVGEYLEAYERYNPNSFRCNLSSGGEHTYCELTPEQTQFCRQVAERAHFPYAHMDLQIMPDGRPYLFEITLSGGIRGSRLNRPDLERLKAERLNQLVQGYA